ncbi:MAG: hypothetical protein FWG66_12335 [Spirochaetes bacterium]|nr:hypothetical protein [Spirochaetota bacterium]
MKQVEFRDSVLVFLSSYFSLNDQHLIFSGKRAYTFGLNDRYMFLRGELESLAFAGVNKDARFYKSRETPVLSG